MCTDYLQVIQVQVFWVSGKPTRDHMSYIIHVMLALFLNVRNTLRPKALKIAVFDHSAVVWRPSMEPREYPHNLILPETTVTGLHFPTDSVGPSSFKFSPWVPENTFFETACLTAVQGRPRSLILTSIEGAYGTFYWWSTATWSYLASFLIYPYGHLLAENCEFSLPQCYLTASLGVNPFEFLDESLLHRRRVLTVKKMWS